VSNTENLQGLKEQSKRLEEKRRSLEEKTKILEEKARTEKLAIDKKLVTEILEEENRTHNDAVRELEDKIANLEQQMKSPLSTENAPRQTAPEPPQESSDNVDDGVTVSVPQQPEQNEAEVPPEGSKKKKRSFY
jgi:hypothetical protein